MAVTDDIVVQCYKTLSVATGQPTPTTTALQQPYNSSTTALQHLHYSKQQQLSTSGGTTAPARHVLVSATATVISCWVSLPEEKMETHEYSTSAAVVHFLRLF